jgi:hypothetical protein
MSELLFYIICNRSSLGGTGKSKYSEDQIKCKVKTRLIKEVLPSNWEVDEWLVYWINFYSSFIAIYYTHMKYRESKIEAVKGKEFGTEQIDHIKKLKFIWDDRKRREKDWWKIFWKNMEKCFGESDKMSRGEKQIYKMAKKDRRKEVFKQKTEEMEIITDYRKPISLIVMIYQNYQMKFGKRSGKTESRFIISIYIQKKRKNKKLFTRELLIFIRRKIRSNQSR